MGSGLRAQEGSVGKPCAPRACTVDLLKGLYSLGLLISERTLFPGTFCEQ